MSKPICVTVWNEGIHEKTDKKVAEVYPQGIHGAIAAHLGKQQGIEVVATATLEQPEHGLTEAVLEKTDVLTWWAHMAHDQVEDKIVDRVHKRVLEGMGLILLHSGHFSKIFQKLMGTGCGLKWREAAEMERLWVVRPGHPIADGLPEYFELAHTEMYGELFDIPQPDELVFISWFEGGEVFRSGCCWHRGKGKVFYFRPGHETFPIYYDENVLKVLANAVRWAAPIPGSPFSLGIPDITEPLNPIRGGEG
ncbi:MAG TPA: ThuA domain-containing protein [Phycisphaerae bacterium]|nr:ThuA domain-containing protein [Phycisphaerae bacterium]